MRQERDGVSMGDDDLCGLDGGNREQYIYLCRLIRMVWTAYHFTVVHEVFSRIMGLIISTRFSRMWMLEKCK